MNTDPRNPNVARLTSAATKLEPLLDQIVFVGGCVTGLLLTDPAAAPVRPTLDVDAIVAISSYADFTLLENHMRQLGFHESHAEGAPVCRWISGDLILDLDAHRLFNPGLRHPLVSSRPRKCAENSDR